MAILDLDAHGKHVTYTMTLAAGGFAYVSASYKAGDTLFGIPNSGPLFSSLVLAATLLAFLVALGFGVAALFGMTGIKQLKAGESELNDEIQSEQLEQEIAGLTQDAQEDDDDDELDKYEVKLRKYHQALSRNSSHHLDALFVAFILTAILFADAKIDPNKSPPDCQLKVNPEGVLVLPVTCVDSAAVSSSRLTKKDQSRDEKFLPT